MDLPDCPPGAEGYHDSVTEVPKKPEIEDSVCTKAEQEFQEHLNSLKIKLEDGTVRCMVEKRGRDVSSNWIYLCYPCAAVCSGESILQTHISGKKHKTKLSVKHVWPASIFDEHPYILRERGIVKSGATEKINQKMAEEVMLYNNSPCELDLKFNKYKDLPCHIQETLDAVKAPLLGVEYLIEHPPEQAHYEPSYLCTLCSKQGHPRTIVNHLTCYWHRWNYVARHFAKASALLVPYRHRSKFRDGLQMVINRLAQRIDDKYGRMKPLNIDKEEFEKEKERIFQWIFKSQHITEELGHTFEEVVDEDLINSLAQPDGSDGKSVERNPSPPVVPAPNRPKFNNHTRPPGRQERRHASTESLSDVSDEEIQRRPDTAQRAARPNFRGRYDPAQKHSFDPYPEKPASAFRSRYVIRNVADKDEKPSKAINHEYKMKLAEEKKQAAIEAAKKTLAYHEKNPEKHPLYPEEWKKFWNKRYKEIQAEGKDPSKHDFKPEWIFFWTARMKELHDEELRVNVTELYRKMGLPPPDFKSEDESSPANKRPRNRTPTRRPDYRKRSPDFRKRSPDYRKRSPDPRRRMPEPRRRSPDPRRRSPDLRRRSPDFRKRSPESAHRRPSPLKRKSPMPRRNSPDYRRPPPDFRRDRRSPGFRESPPRRRSPERRRSPVHKRSLSPVGHRTGSPLSQRAAHRNRTRSRSRSPHTAPSLQTVLISDDELKPDDGLSPWNSDNDMDSIGSKNEMQSRGGSVTSRATRPLPRATSRGPLPTPQDFGPADNVVATLRLLVALEDYLGSLGPKIIDLLTEALKMEKEKANSSEDLLIRESAVGLLETAKEKLKGVVQAGLVGGGAGAAVRAAVVRVASTLHDAETRAKRSKKPDEDKGAPVAVAGVGEVDRAEIAAQMAAALVAEGRTDVSPEELAQLVDAVVGMAEAKKREAQAKKQTEAKSITKVETPQPQSKANPASALQMLQSAYDDGSVPQPKQDAAADAMDGLSDSDLETLLRNFNELSAEEQHSLIAYLKKLEVREPQRVERLRRFVTAAVPNTQPTEQHATTIESDDDDYTVEEVFKSVTQKVKESQIQQEMEIVKKSLEETKASEVPTEQHTVDQTAKNAQNISSAADLLALVQASIQSTSQSTPKPITQMVDHVVTTNNQPRSFGDMPELTAMNIDATKAMTNLMNPSVLNQSPRDYHEGFAQSQNQMNFGGNGQSEAYGQNVRSNVREPLLPDVRQQPMMERPLLTRDPTQNYNNRQYSFTSDNRQSLMSDDRQPLLNDIRQSLMGDNRTSLISDHRQTLLSDNRPPLINDNRQSSMNDNRQPLMNDNRQPLMNDNRQPPMNDNRQHFMSDNRQPSIRDHRQPLLGDNRPSFYNDNRQPLIGDHRQSLMGDHRPPPLMGDNRPPSLNDNRPPLIGDNRQPLMSDNRQPLMGDNRQPLMGDNRQPLMSDNRQPLMGDNRQPLMGDNRQPLMGDNRQPLMGDNRQPLMGDNRQPLLGDNRQPLMSDNRQPLLGDNRQHLMYERQPLIADNRQPLMGDRQPLIADNRQPLMGDRQPLMGDRQPLMGDRQPLMGDRQPLMGDNRQPLMGDNRQPLMGDRQSLIGDRQPLMGDRQPLMSDNRMNDTRQPLMADERETMRLAMNNFNQVNNFNDESNSSYGRKQDSFNSNNETDQQRFSNYNNKMNFRGRGRGQFGGGVRGGRSRGRGRN